MKKVFNSKFRDNKAATIVCCIQILLVLILLFVSWPNTPKMLLSGWCTFTLVLLILRLFSFYRDLKFSKSQVSEFVDYCWLLLLSVAWSSVVFILIPEDRSVTRGILGLVMGVIVGTVGLILNSRRKRVIFLGVVLASLIYRCFLATRPEPFLIGFFPGLTTGWFLGLGLNAESKRNLSLRILLLYGAVICLITGVYAYQLTLFWSRTTQKFDQHKQWHLAAQIAEELQQAVQDELDLLSVNRVFYKHSIRNNKLDFYLFTEQGQFLTGIVPSMRIYGNLAREENVKLDIEEINQALQLRNSQPPLFWLEPLERRRKTTFSIAPVMLGKTKGYVYIVFDGVLYDLLNRKLTQQTLTKLIILISLGSVLWVTILGLFIYRYLTQRIGKLISEIKLLGGNPSLRLTMKSNDEISEFARVFNHMTDTIESKNRELENSDRKQRQLIADVTGDLKDPLELTVDLINKLGAQCGELSNNEKLSIIRSLQKQVSIQNQLVGDLFELSKLEIKGRQLDLELFALQELVQDIFIQRSKRIEEQGIELQLDIPEIAIETEGDLALLGRAIGSVVDHVLNHLDSGGKIHVVVEGKAEGVNLVIKISVDTKVKQILDISKKIQAIISGIAINIAEKICELHRTKLDFGEIDRSSCYFCINLYSSHQSLMGR